MKIFNKLENYLNEQEYKMVIRDNQINIVNYDEIVDFSSNKIIIKKMTNLIIIDGKNLTISKMLDNEVLISGIISNIHIN